jgi:hypothetical protein
VRLDRVCDRVKITAQVRLDRVCDRVKITAQVRLDRVCDRVAITAQVRLDRVCDRVKITAQVRLDRVCDRVKITAQVRLAGAAGGARKLAPGALALFTDGEPGELVLSECSQLEPSTLAPALASASGEQCAPPCDVRATWGCAHGQRVQRLPTVCTDSLLGLCADREACVGIQTRV